MLYNQKSLDTKFELRLKTPPGPPFGFRRVFYNDIEFKKEDPDSKIKENSYG
jgi:hypothetical protein